MKTITLTDDAYERLASWKRTPKDSFSSVVIAVVARRGTLGDLVTEVRKAPDLKAGFFKSVEEARKNDHNPKWERNPWTAQRTRSF